MARIAIISDIHGNLEALRAVLEDIACDHADAVVCLGDIVGYGPDPGTCVELVAEVCDRVVLGNHDEAACSPNIVSRFNPHAAASILATRERLGDDHLRYLRALPDTARIEGIALTHASFGFDPYEYVYAESSAARSLNGMPTRVGCIGHTHIPAVFGSAQRLMIGEDDVVATSLPADVDVKLPEDMVLIINPGSVGQPRDRNPDASWAMLDTQRWTVSLRRVAYDVALVSSKIAGLGLPEYHAERLRLGA